MALTDQYKWLSFYKLLETIYNVIRDHLNGEQEYHWKWEWQIRDKQPYAKRLSDSMEERCYRTRRSHNKEVNGEKSEDP